MKRILALVTVLILALSLAACGEGEETTMTGMVVSVEGTVISLVEMGGNMGGTGEKGERPQMPEGMEGFDPENFDPESFNGTLPNGETIPQRGDGQRPEGGWSEGERPQLPEGMTMPEGMTPPENGEKPEGGQRPEGMEGRFENFMSDAETKKVDIANAHISVEEDGVRATGSLSDIKQGSFVTITMNGKGEATNVLVTQRTGFGGGRRTAGQ